MKILLVEDDEQRYNNFKKALESMSDDSCFANSQIYGETLLQTINEQPDPIDLYFELFKIIEEEGIDFVFMDLFLLRNDDNNDMPTGIFLANKLRNNVLHERIPIVLHSRQYNTIGDFRDHAELMVGNAHYIPTKNVINSVDNLVRKIREIFDDKCDQIIAEIESYEKRTFDYNLAIIAALDKEYNAVKKLIQENDWKDIKIKKGYKRAYWENKDKEIILKVTLTSMNNNMGMVVATMRTLDLINLTKPVLVAMTGIAGGSKKSGARLGDICVAKTVDNWQSGKYTPENFELTPETIEIDQALKVIIETDYIQDSKQTTIIDKIINEFGGDKINNLIDNEIQKEQEYLKTLTKQQEKSDYRKTIRKKERLPEFKFADMMTGSSLVADEKVIDEGMHTRNRKAFFFDMEGYAVARVAYTKQRKWLVVKAIVDYGNILKSDFWHDFASFASAKFLYELSFDIFGENE